MDIHDNSFQPEKNPSNPTDRLESSSKVISYLALREVIGLIGITLPFLLMLGTHFLDKCSPTIQYSISHYYYTKMHMLFVGLLCVLGAFLITYKGGFRGENIVSTIAGFAAIAVAVFPDDMNKYLYVQPNCSFIQTQKLKEYVPSVHFTSAAILFLCFAVICIFYFTRPDTPKPDDIKKNRRNTAYKICGVGIVVSLLFCFLFMKNIIPSSEAFSNHVVFIFETTSLLFFGFSWLLKGSLMWPTKKYILPSIIKYFR